jgi:hypothetical protein
MDKTQQAKNLLNDPFFMGEIEAMKELELKTIVNSQPSQVEEREFAYNRLNALQSVITHFESIAATSEIVKKRWKIL